MTTSTRLSHLVMETLSPGIAGEVESSTTEEDEEEEEAAATASNPPLRGSTPPPPTPPTPPPPPPPPIEAEANSPCRLKGEERARRRSSSGLRMEWMDYNGFHAWSEENVGSKRGLREGGRGSEKRIGVGEDG